MFRRNRPLETVRFNGAVTHLLSIINIGKLSVGVTLQLGRLVLMLGRVMWEVLELKLGTPVGPAATTAISLVTTAISTCSPMMLLRQSWVTAGQTAGQQVPSPTSGSAPSPLPSHGHSHQESPEPSTSDTTGGQRPLTFSLQKNNGREELGKRSRQSCQVRLLAAKSPVNDVAITTFVLSLFV